MPCHSQDYYSLLSFHPLIYSALYAGGRPETCHRLQLRELYHLCFTVQLAGMSSISRILCVSNADKELGILTSNSKDLGTIEARRTKAFWLVTPILHYNLSLVKLEKHMLSTNHCFNLWEVLDWSSRFTVTKKRNERWT